jgi:signal transduction histidine kinase
MNIRTKLTASFFTIVIIVLTMISVSIYFFSSNYRKVDFYRRLKNRAMNTAKVLMEVKEVNAELLRRMERNNPASLPNQFIIIYNYKNEELYSSEGIKPIKIDTALLNRIRLDSEVSYKEGSFEILGFLFTGKNDRFTVVAAATDVYGLDALRNLRNVLLVTFGISVVIVSFLGWIYAGRVLSPISRIVNEVGSITEANLNRRLDEGNQKDELNKLAGTFNQMLERLQGAFTSQKSFIANASHEIKTPITVMSGEIEVALLHDRDKGYYIKVMKSVLGGLKGLNTLSSQLLLLAQTSTDEPDRNFTLIRIDDILWEMKEELLKAHPDYKVDILFDLDLKHESLLINGDEQLVKVAVLNLLDNGCKYSDASHVVVNLNSKISGYIGIDFINSGPGIAPQNIERIFAPFYRGSNKTIKGFGIGLSLVNRIVKLHDGKVAVESTQQQQTRFTITFPIRRQDAI